MLHEMSAQNIDEVLIGLNVGKVLSHYPKTFIPKWHSVYDAVRLRCRSHVFPPRSCQLEGVPHDTITSAAREETLLDRHLLIGIGIHTTADFRVLAFVVLTDDAKINVARFEPLERRLDPGEQTNWPQVH